MRQFYKFLREHTMKMIYFKKKSLNLLLKEQQKSCETAKICYLWKKKKKENKYLKDEKYREARDNCHYAGEYGGAAHTTCTLKYSAIEYSAIKKEFL